jgi:NMD protein affecting ribosome stability and mRNA decay
LDKIVKCTNCGKISAREHILPLCQDCFVGLEDYERFLANSAIDIELAVDKKLVKADNFLKL